jgi:hypothetical protein
MFDEHDKAKTYRGRAEHARLGAEETKSPDLREILRKLALSYDAQADEAERLAQSHAGERPR